MWKEVSMKFIQYMTESKPVVLISGIYFFICFFMTVYNGILFHIFYGIYSLIVIIIYMIGYVKYRKSKKYIL